VRGQALSPIRLCPLNQTCGYDMGGSLGRHSDTTTLVGFNIASPVGLLVIVVDSMAAHPLAWVRMSRALAIFDID